jgi:hypothetical protein
MIITEIENIKKENDEWSQTIDYITQECVLMKNRLSNLLELFHASFAVDWAENFQSRIIMKEQVLELIRKDIKEQQKQINDNHFNYSKNNHHKIKENHEDIRNKIFFLEKSCLEMKQSFNDFLSIHLML